MKPAWHAAAYVLTLAAGFTLGCYWFSPWPNDNYPKYAPAHRPPSLPDSAVWIGGPDGGTYIDCYYNAVTRRDDCSAYNDFTGQREIEGAFVLKGHGEGVTPEKLKYSFFDGNTIYLRLPDENGRIPGLVLATQPPGAQ